MRPSLHPLSTRAGARAVEAPADGVALFLLCDVALLVLAVIAVLLRGRSAAASIVYGGALVLSLALLAGALVHMVTDASPDAIVLPIGLPWIGANFRLDALSAFFLVVINLGAAAASLYGIGYGRHEHEPQRVLPFFPAFLAGMNLVLLADDAFTFLASWEFMSLASWALVMAHHQERDNTRAGFVYIVMASLGTMALLLAFRSARRARRRLCFCGNTGERRDAGPRRSRAWPCVGRRRVEGWPCPAARLAATRASRRAKPRIRLDERRHDQGCGLWLRAHRLRSAGSRRPGGGALPVMALGAGTAVLGVLHALMQNDLKRVLAYSTIENIGLIFAGLGLALAFKANGFGGAAALAATAALFHALNHAIFKSLLFFGAGAILTSTGERGMERLGGLLNRMPATGLFVLIGSMAISALPPLNGFASDWLLLQSILLSPQLPQWALKILAPAVGATLALAAALAAACFVRVFGIAFLGRPRSPLAEIGARGRPDICRSHGNSRRPLPARGHFSRSRHRCACARRPRPHRGANASASGNSLAFHRADRRESQLLQRSSRIPVHRGLRLARRLCDPSDRLR